MTVIRSKQEFKSVGLRFWDATIVVEYVREVLGFVNNCGREV